MSKQVGKYFEKHCLIVDRFIMIEQGFPYELTIFVHATTIILHIFELCD